MIYTYTLRKQVNMKGYFASITFELSTDETKTRKLITDLSAASPWEIACNAGIVLFFEQYQRPGELSVKVKEIHWLPVDTNHLIVLFATYHGLCEALGIEINGLQFDTENLNFIFPARGKKR